MAPAQNLLHRHYNVVNGRSFFNLAYFLQDNENMKLDYSSTSPPDTVENSRIPAEGEGSSSNSKPLYAKACDHNKYKGWLRLSISDMEQPPAISDKRELVNHSPAAADGVQAIRIVRPTRPLPAGVWFMLQVARNHGGEPVLPQIPKSYLRIKDGRMTVKLLMKYLATKLGLVDDSKVEVTCRGLVLPPYLTLQHVRDRIWCAIVTNINNNQERDEEDKKKTSHDTSAVDHVMTLNYRRRSSAFSSYYS